MSFTESDSWQRLRPIILHLDPVRIETRDKIGVSDVNYAEGWIELKHKAEWPKRSATKLAMDHFTPEQRAFLGRRGRIGNAFLLLHVSSVNEWLLFHGPVATTCVGNLSQSGLKKVALLVETGHAPDPRKLLPLLNPRV